MFDDIKKANPTMADDDVYKKIAGELGFADPAREVANLKRIKTGGEKAVTMSDLNAARDAADERLKTTKKDAVSRKLAEAHMTGIDNDTSRMAKQLLSNQEFLKYAAEFDNLDFDGETTFGDYLRKNFGKEVTKNGKVDFTQMFKSQSDPRGDIKGAEAIQFTIKKNDVEISGVDLGFTTDPRVKVNTNQIVDAVYDLQAGQVIIDFGGSVGKQRIDIEKLKGTGIAVDGSDTLTTVSISGTNVTNRTKGTSKKTVAASAKDKGEAKGDQFRNSEFFIDAQASKREAEKNKNK